jgi:hypothetical protein
MTFQCHFARHYTAPGKTIFCGPGKGAGNTAPIFERISDFAIAVLFWNEPRRWSANEL